MGSKRAKARVIAFANQKGGVGKTTTTVNLAVELVSQGKRVLVIDLDPQAATTVSSGVGDPDNIEQTVYHVLLEPEKGIAFAVIPTPCGYDLLPANLDLAGIETEVVAHRVRMPELRLRYALDGVRDEYDFVLIDCAPTLTMLLLFAAAAADEVWVPVSPQYLSVRGMAKLAQTLEALRNDYAKVVALNGDITRIIITMYDGRTGASGDFVEQMRQRFGDIIFETMIPVNTKLSEAPAAGVPVRLYSASSRGAKAYRALAVEIVAEEVRGG